MKVDPKRQIALLRRINSPVIVPAGDERRARSGAGMDQQYFPLPRY
jgi:hypothetical protein